MNELKKRKEKKKLILHYGLAGLLITKNTSTISFYNLYYNVKPKLF
jgi:hypothetical protein